MCLLRNIMNAVHALRMRLYRGFTVVFHRRAAMTILSLLMIVIMLTCWTVAPLSYSRAVLTEVIVVGGGALTLGMLLDLLMTCFGASGMDGAVRNQAAAVGTPPVAFVGNLLNRFLATTLSAVLPSEWAQTISNGLTVLSNGTIFLNSDATAAIADFQQWAWSEDGANLISFAPISEGNDGILTDANGNQVKVLQFPTGIVHGDYTMQLACSNGTTNYYIGTTGSAKIVAYIERVGGVVSRSVIRVAPYATVPDGTTAGFTAVYGSWRQQTVANWSDSRFVQVTGTFNSSGFDLELPISDVSFTSFDSTGWSGGEDIIGDVETFVGPMMQGQGTEIPLGDVVTVSPEAAGRLHLANYLRATAAAYAGDGTADVPVTDDDTGEDETYPVSVPLDNPIGVIGLSDSAIDQTGASAGTDAVSTDFAGVDEYTMDLSQYFPFCIPFDLALLFEKFEAEAQAPVIEWPVPVPGQEEPFLVRLDFAAFDSVAVILRKMELIAFAIGLCFLTKNLIQGGD